MRSSEKKEKSWNGRSYGFPEAGLKYNINLFESDFEFDKPINFNSLLEELNSIIVSNKVLGDEPLHFTITDFSEQDCRIIIFKEHTYTKEDCQKEKEDFIKKAEEEFEKLYPFERFVKRI